MSRPYRVRRYRRPNSRRQESHLKAKLFLILLILIAFFLYAQKGVNELVGTFVREKAQMVGVSFLSNAVEATLEEYADACKNLVSVQKKTSGGEQGVSTVEIDTLALNQIENQIIKSVAKELESVQSAPLEIPLGVFTGSPLFSGFGPRLHFELYPAGYLHTKLISNFDSAGINQTRHRIVLEVSVNIYCTVPFYQEHASASTDFVLAETVIVGEIPQYYTKVISEDEKELSQINDYGNGTALGMD